MTETLDNTQNHSFKTLFFKIFNRKVVIGIILAALIIAYNFVWINRMYIFAEGWANMYNGLMDQGKVPYVDFYYYMPPFNLFYEYILEKLSFGYVIIYRMFRLAERVFAAELLYWMMIKRVQPWIAAAGCFLGAVLTTANNYFVAGDYNSFCEVLAVLICFTFYMYHENVDKPGIRKYVWAGAVGIVGGMMFLTKQTIFLSSAIVFTILYLLFVFLKVEKNYWRSIFFVFVGAMTPIAIASIYLLANHAFIPFIEQCFLKADSKGSIFRIVFVSLFNVYRVHIFGVLFFAGFLVAYYFYKRQKATKVVLIVTLSILAVSLGFGIYYALTLGVFKNITGISLAVLAVQLAIIVGCQFNKYTKQYSLLFVLVATLIIIVACGPNLAPYIKGNNTVLPSLVSGMLTILFDVLFLWVIYHIISHHKDKNYDFKVLIFVFSSAASAYCSLMANGEIGVVTLNATIAIPAIVYLIFRDRKAINIYVSSTYKFIIVAFFTICISYKMVNPYSWWGDNQAPFWEKTETVNIRKLKGIKVTPEEKIKYEVMNDIILEYADKDDVIWSFPYGCVYNVFEDNYNMVGFVPIPFYDVCPNDYAAQEAVYLAERNPDIVVWLDIPGCIEAHESIYNAGQPIGQRKIQEWFSKNKDSKYTLVGQVSNVFIYKLNDGTPITKTYIADPDAINSSAEYPEQ